eukprot:s2572_g12.t1
MTWPRQLEEVKLVGDRLHYKRITGTGPEEGWVSTKISGKELVVKKEVDDTPAEDVGGPGWDRWDAMDDSQINQAEVSLSAGNPCPSHRLSL